MTTSAMAPRLCSPHWRWRKARSLDNVTPGTGSQEFLKFLKQLDQEFPEDITLHVVMDNYGTHKHPRIQNWLKRHPRFVSHFVPTSSSWLNLVERWFGELT